MPPSRRRCQECRSPASPPLPSVPDPVLAARFPQPGWAQTGRVNTRWPSVNKGSCLPSARHVTGILISRTCPSENTQTRRTSPAGLGLTQSGGLLEEFQSLTNPETLYLICLAADFTDFWCLCIRAWEPAFAGKLFFVSFTLVSQSWLWHLESDVDSIQSFSEAGTVPGFIPNAVQVAFPLTTQALNRY